MKNITVKTMLENIFAKDAKKVSVLVEDCTSMYGHFLYNATVHLDNNDNTIIEKKLEILSANIHTNGDIPSFNTIKGIMDKNAIAQHIVSFDLYKKLIDLEFRKGTKEVLQEKTTNEFHFEITTDVATFVVDNIIVVSELSSQFFE